METQQFETVEELVNSDKFCEWVLSNQQSHHAFWTNWQQNNSDKTQMIEAAILLVQQLSFKEISVEESEINQMLNNVITKIDQQEIPTTNPTQRSISKWKFLRIAAAILFLIGASWMSYNKFFSMTIYRTDFGEVKTIQLEDKSTVQLQANSVLKLKKNWMKQTERAVWLDGEAFFSVEKASHSIPEKFKVYTKDFNIEVLGTQFNVLHRAKKKAVVLEEGKIRMQVLDPNNHASKAFDLKPNEMVSYSNKEQLYKKQSTNAQQQTSWKKGLLYLNNTSLTDLTRILEDNFGYRIILKLDTTKEKNIQSVGAINIRNPKLILETIKASFDINITQQKTKTLLLQKE